MVFNGFLIVKWLESFDQKSRSICDLRTVVLYWSVGVKYPKLAPKFTDYYEKKIEKNKKWVLSLI